MINQAVPQCNHPLGSLVVTQNNNGNLMANSRVYCCGTLPSQILTDRGFTGQKSNNQPSADLGLLYYNARYYVPTLGKFASADTLVPDPLNPQRFNRYTYTLNNPLKFTDPSGHRTCTAQQAATGDETCDQSHTTTYTKYNDTALFSHTVMCTPRPNNSSCYIKVDFSEGPWGFYATQLGASVGDVFIPIGIVDLEWLGDPESTYAGLEGWELNARNIFAELHGVIASRKEYAVADSIGIAYGPYNRRDSVGESWSGISVKEQLLRGSGTTVVQYAIGFKDSDGNWVMSGVRPSDYEQLKVFEFVLIVAYGVEHDYLWDPSFGSQNYAHRTDTENGPAYFRNPGSSNTAFDYLRQRGLIQ